MTNRNASIQRGLLGFNAIVAWAAVAVSFSLMLTGYYINEIDPKEPTLIGNLLEGKDQVWERFFDWISYFTILSNIVVAVVLTLLIAKPELFTQKNSAGNWWRALRLDSVIMILITGVVYNMLLSSGPKEGWDNISNSLQHNINPLITAAVFFVAGPRGLLSLSTIARSMALPIAWAVLVLIRGAVINAYPYFFLNISDLGLVSVVLFILQILVFALVIAFALWGYDRLISRR